MSVISAAQIRAAAKSRVNESNVNSVLVALDKFGLGLGLNRPHRVAHYLAQLMHESGAFRFDQEIWGPTAAQARYDTRTDLGNTPAADGDGYLTAAAPASRSPARRTMRPSATGAVRRILIRLTSLLSRTSLTPIRGKASCRSGTGRPGT
ncbi:hypothetical protein [Neorhizobium sp. T25_13]|uniref:hypothetical protein n=1 Tax=Neorhizobium sp. T25_13 TaxID=2093830 RepID=UPI001FE05777|nr:hypothetical protein [Neorhizobium sp. T25_13]